MTLAAVPDLLSPTRLTMLQPMRAPRMPSRHRGVRRAGRAGDSARDASGPSRWLPLVTAAQARGASAILHMLTKLVHRPRVITLDTRAPARRDAYDLIDHVRDRFGVDVEVILPAATEVEPMVRERGAKPVLPARPEDRMRCCEVRRVLPLKRALAGEGGWITGLRRDQATTRSSNT